MVSNSSFDFRSHYMYLYHVGASERVLSLRQKSRIFANAIFKNSQYSTMLIFSDPGRSQTVLVFLPLVSMTIEYMIKKGISRVPSRSRNLWPKNRFRLHPSPDCQNTSALGSSESLEYFPSSKL